MSEYDDNNKPTLVNLNLPPDELAAALEQFKRQLPQLKQYQEYSAALIHAKYCALLKEGFDEKQALTLCATL